MKKAIFCFALACIMANAYSQNVVHGEYFIGIDSGFGAAVPFTISPFDTDVTQGFDIPYGAFPGPGYHYVFFRTKDDSSRWSHTARKLIDVGENTPPDNVIRVEYFFEVDNGFGSNSSVQLTASTDSTWEFNIPESQLPATWTPDDTLFLRVHDSIRGNWSITTMIDSLNLGFVGINELEALTGVSVFPNPFSEEINISLQGDDKTDIAIYNESGQLIFERSAVRSTIKINTKDISSGAYFIYVKGENQKTFRSRIMKQ